MRLLLKIRVIAVGKDKDRWTTESCAHFEKLLSRYARVEWKIVSPAKGSSLSPDLIKKDESERILKALGKGLVVALADTGESLDSPSFARKLEKWQTISGGTLNLVVGGAYGLNSAIMKRADSALSLSPLTMSHQLVRPVLLEQLYRAFSILHGTDYHK